MNWGEWRRQCDVALFFRHHLFPLRGDRARMHRIPQNDMLPRSVAIFLPAVFHRIVSACSWPQPRETSKGETVDEEGLLCFLEAAAVCYTPRQEKRTALFGLQSQALWDISQPDEFSCAPRAPSLLLASCSAWVRPGFQSRTLSSPAS